MQMNRVIPAALLVTGLALMQFHSIAFWSEAVGPLTGWAFSLQLEAAALWLWFSPRRAHRALGAVATLLLLAGPVYQVTAPVIEAQTAAVSGVSQAADRRAVLLAEIGAIEASLATYRKNSESRQGWFGLIEQAEADLSARRGELAAVQAAQFAAPVRMAWQAQAVLLMQALALVLFQLANVLAIRALSLRPEASVGRMPAGQSAEKQGKRPFLVAVR